MRKLLSVLSAFFQTHFKAVESSSPSELASHCLVIAYSGGVDSTLLLHACNLLSKDGVLPPVKAVHVHHGLSPNAGVWQRHCADQCAALGVEFDTYNVCVEKVARKSLEASARDARYKVLLDYCKKQRGILVLGQHQDDQLETVLLQLKRGAGPKGLAAMGAKQNRENVTIVRPLLSVTKQQILQYADEANLKWINDESNTNEQFDRNFLRHSVIPAITQRWPSFAQTASRSAALCYEQQTLLDEVVTEKLSDTLIEDHIIDLEKFTAHPIRWAKVMLRAWLQRLQAPLASEAQLAQLLAMIEAREDSQPLVTFEQWQFRRYRNRLFGFNKAQFSAFEQAEEPFYNSQSGRWVVPHFNQDIDIQCSLIAPICRISLTALTFRIKPIDRDVTKPLKQWLKEWDIPPWERGRLPIVFVNEHPVALLLENETIYLSLPSELSSIEINRTPSC